MEVSVKLGSLHPVAGVAEAEGSFGKFSLLLRSIVVIGGADKGISSSAFLRPIFLDEDPNDSFAFTGGV